MGMFKDCFTLPADERILARLSPREIPRPALLRQSERHGTSQSSRYINPATPRWTHTPKSATLANRVVPNRTVTAPQNDYFRSRSVTVSEADVGRSETFDRAEMRAAFERWGKSPIEVQQDVERRVRDDEILRRWGYNSHRADRVDNHKEEHNEALSRACKRCLGELSRQTRKRS